MDSLIPILINVDVEPDEREITLGSDLPWVGFEKTVACFTEVRSRLEKVTRAPVHFNWLVRLDPQIETTYGDAGWAIKRYRSLFSQLEEAGDEIGIHPHTWQWQSGTKRWKSVYDDPEWVRHCLDMSVQAFRQGFSRSPRICKFGDHYVSEQTVSLLEEYGFECDMSLEPGYRGRPQAKSHELSSATTLDFRRALRFPYRPSRRNFLQAGSWWSRRRIWMIPLSSGGTSGEVIYSHDDTDREIMTLNLEFYAPIFRYIADALIGRSAKPYLSMVMRTDVPTRDHERTQMETSFDYLATHPWVNRFRFVTGAEAVRDFFR